MFHVELWLVLPEAVHVRTVHNPFECGKMSFQSQLADTEEPLSPLKANVVVDGVMTPVPLVIMVQSGGFTGVWIGVLGMLVRQ